MSTKNETTVAEATKETQKVTVLDRIKKLLKLDDAGRVEKFFVRETKKMLNNIDTLEMNKQAKAFELMQAAAQQGYALAQHGLGFMYLEGECATKNPSEAAQWFRLAGEQGLQGSLATLALMYKQGNGVPQDEIEARRLYTLAGFGDAI